MDKKKTKDAFGTLLDGAKDAGTAARLIEAEQDLIAYYFDVLKAKAAQMMSGGSMARVPAERTQGAVRVLNKACADQKVPYLFDGKIDNPADLFRFAGCFVPDDAAA